MLPPLSPATIHPALPALVGKLGARRVILYGSRARGDNAPRADIDLCVDVPGGLDAMVWDKMMQAVENAETLLKIDFVVLQEAGADLAANILRDGKVLYDAE